MKFLEFIRDAVLFVVTAFVVVSLTVLVSLAIGNAFRHVCRTIHPNSPSMIDDEVTVSSWGTPRDGLISSLRYEVEFTSPLYDGENKAVWVIAERFDDQEIADAFIAAARKKVRVRVITSSRWYVDSRATLKRMSREGVEIWVDRSHPIHGTVIIIGNDRVRAGSFVLNTEICKQHMSNASFIKSAWAAEWWSNREFPAHLKHCTPFGVVID